MWYNIQYHLEGGYILDIKEVLEQLTNTYSASGFEHKIIEQLKESFKPYCDEIIIDKFYNFYAIKKANLPNPNSRKLMIACHIDEVGMMVKEIDKSGFIKFVAIGGVDAKNLPAKEVLIHGASTIKGIIGAKPPHLIKPDEKDKVIPIKDLYIDTGYDYDELIKVVKIGDTITYQAHFTELKDNKFYNKSMDNRASVATMLEFLVSMKNLLHSVDIVCCGTVQEELGLRGAMISSYNISPDVCVVIDGAFANTHGLSKGGIFKYFQGPAIAVGPNLHKNLTNYMIDIAKSEAIPYQIDVEEGNTGTDAWAIQISRQGIPTLLLSIPLGYMHSDIESIVIDDLKNTAKLLCKFTTNIGERIEKLYDIRESM